MIVFCELIVGALSAGALTLYGLIIDGVGAFVISGFSITPVNIMGRKIWPPYRKISSAWDALHEDGKVSKGDYGFEELANTIGSKESIAKDSGLKASDEDLEYKYIKYSDDSDKPYTDSDDIEIEIGFADHVDDTYNLNYTDISQRELSVELINQRIRNGFLKCGSIMLIIGFSLQIYAQIARLFGLNLLTC